MYNFTRVRPPLLKENQDIRSISDIDLAKQIGFDTWTSERIYYTDPIVEGGPFLNIIVPALKETSNFSATRILKWVILNGPVHYASDTNVSITQFSGYKKTERLSVEKMIGVDAGGSFFGMINASVKANLKITEDTTREWKEETTIKVDVVYKKNCTYVTWILVDYMKITKRSVAVSLNRNVPDQNRYEEAIIGNVIATYHDYAEDANMAIFNKIVDNL